MEAIKQQFERMNEEADKHIADAQYRGLRIIKC